MENEVWKDVVGYEGLYQVSSFGKVKRLKNGKERILKPQPNGFGYLFVNLYKNKINKHFKVHRLVAKTFIPNPDNLPQVNHIDEDKTNNHVDNLEWCDAKYNINFGTRNKRFAESKSKKVDQYSLDDKFLKTWPSAKQAQKELGIFHSNICRCCRGNRKSAGNFIWKYHQDQTN